MRHVSFIGVEKGYGKWSCHLPNRMTSQMQVIIKILDRMQVREAYQSVILEILSNQRKDPSGISAAK
jgi:hypothetical protein